MADHRHALLGQDKVYSSLVSKFFESREFPDLAWLHHLACRRYGDAASNLLVVDQAEEGLAQKHVRQPLLFIEQS
jgi:nuclear pore complex protein Nup133